PDMDFTFLLEEYVARGCRGIGELLPKMSIDDPRCLNLFHQAGRFKLPVVIDLHSRPVSYGLEDAPGLPGLERVLRVCPETIIVGHGPTFWAEISGQVSAEERQGYPSGPVKPGGAVPRLMKTYPNLFADLSAGSGYNALTRDLSFGLDFLEAFQDKLLFGTDYCVRSHTRNEVKIIDFFHRLKQEKLISLDAWEKIAWKNAARLLNYDRKN
ncbi:MAG: amidohydrolase, partial [Candidatus Omnitrophica bacterium]|nr:amidohydrolase [Candidatus Omnitrophota bacterium]